MAKRYLRRIYNTNKSSGKYLCLLFPQELVNELTPYVFVEKVEDGLLVRPTLVVPK